MTQNYAHQKLAVDAGYASRRKIAEVSGTGASGVLEFASIPATYRNLYLSVVGRADAASTSVTANLTFETSPTAGAYDYQLSRGIASSASASENIGTTHAAVTISLPAASSSANLYGGAIITILEYANTGMFKAVDGLILGLTNISTGVIAADHYVGLWESTAAIDRVRLTLGAGNWTTASRATLYGDPV